MWLSDIELLRHIFDEITFILSAPEDKSKTDIISDPILSRAIIRSLEIIGEASTKLNPDFKALHPYDLMEKNYSYPQ